MIDEVPKLYGCLNPSKSLCLGCCGGIQNLTKIIAFWLCIQGTFFSFSGLSMLLGAKYEREKEQRYALGFTMISCGVLIFYYGNTSINANKDSILNWKMISYMKRVTIMSTLCHMIFLINAIEQELYQQKLDTETQTQAADQTIYLKSFSEILSLIMIPIILFLSIYFTLIVHSNYYFNHYTRQKHIEMILSLQNQGSSITDKWKKRQYLEE